LEQGVEAFPVLGPVDAVGGGAQDFYSRLLQGDGQA